MEDADYGLCFSSGLAATSTITTLLSSGQRIICVDDVYGGTNRFFTKVLPGLGISVTFIDACNSAKIAHALTPETKLVWIETPTNPMMKIVDIAEVCQACHSYSSDIIVAVDNTFMTPFFQKPLALGADLAIHSMTKYLNGHSDVVMGAVATKRADLFERLKFLQKAVGAVPSPFDCWLVHRGIRTLHLRMREHMVNGLAVARFLEESPKVEKVLHPGLPSHPQHELHKSQSSGCSGMCGFYIRGGLHEAKVFLENLKIFVLAESLGGYESLVEIPSLMTHASVPQKDRQALGITDNFIRLSVGLESACDLVEDLRQALDAAVP